MLLLAELADRCYNALDRLREKGERG